MADGTIARVWSISNGTAKYTIGGVVALTISGLSKNGIPVSDSGTPRGIDISTSDTGKGTITVNSDLLDGNSKVTFTSGNGYDYSVGLGQNTPVSKFSNVTTTLATSGTLTVKGNIEAGYKLSEDGKTITYVAAKTNQVLATVSNLKGNLKGSGNTLTYTTEVDGTPTAAITINEETSIITLYESALNGKDITLTPKNGSDYKLAILGITASEVSNVTAKVNSKTKTTADIKGKFSEGYNLSEDKKTLKYTKATENEVVLATITNLQSDSINESNISFEGSTIKLKEDVLGTNAKKATTLSMTKAYEVFGYKLALDEDSDGDGKIGFKENPAYWKVESNGTKASYKYDTDPGWTLAANGKSVTYTAAKTGTALATISGLAKNSNGNGTYTPDEGGNTYSTDGDNSATLKGITIDSEKNITLSKDVLSTTKVALTSTDYKLATGTDVDTKSDKQLVWTVSGTTATLRETNPVYYKTAEDGKTITYTATATKDSSNKALPVLATIKGLASGLKVGTGANIGKLVKLNDDGEEVVVAEITKPAIDSTAGEITLYKGATAKSNITIGAKENYTLVLNKDGDEDTVISAPKTDNGTWTFNNGTLTLSAIIDPGFVLSADGKTATYYKDKISKGESVAQTVVTIKGLNKNLFEKGKVEKEDLANKGIDIVVNETTGNATVTLSSKALSAGNVTVDKSNYQLVIGSDVRQEEAPGKKPTAEDTWIISGTTATFENVVPAYYTYDSTTNAITYHKPEVTKDMKTNKENVFAVLTGLDSKLAADLIVEGSSVYYVPKPDSSADADVEEPANGTEERALAFSIDNKRITIADPEAITTKAVKIDTKKYSGYSLALANAAGRAPKASDDPEKAPAWSVSGTTATLKGSLTAGWTVTDSAVTYVAQKSNQVLATVSGIASGYKNSTNSDVDSDGEKVGTGKIGKTVTAGDGTKYFKVASIEAKTETTGEDDDAKTNLIIELGENVFNKKDITLSSSAGYKLAIAEDANIPEPVSEDSDGVKYGYRIDEDTTTINNISVLYGTTEGYTLNGDGDKITYTAANFNQNRFTITGLGKNIKVSDDMQSIIILDVNGDPLKDDEGNDITDNAIIFDQEDKTFTIDARILGPANVTVNEEYELKIKDGANTIDTDNVDNNSIGGEESTIWSYNPNTTTATLREYTTPSYTIKTTTKSKKTTWTIEYKKGVEGKRLAEVSGLKSGLTVKNGEVGVVTSGKFTPVLELDDKTIKVSEGAIDKKKDITLNKEINLEIDPETEEVSYQYKLDFGDDIYYKEDGEEDPKVDKKADIKYLWTRTKDKTTASLYVGTQKAGYALLDDDGQSLGYRTKSGVTTTISGLQKFTDTTISNSEEKLNGITLEGDTINLDSSVLSTSTSTPTTIKGGDYKLALDEDDENAKLPEAKKREWSYNASKGTAVLQGVYSEGGWLVADDEKSISYVKETEGDKKSDVLTISGLAKKLTGLETYGKEDSDADADTDADSDSDVKEIVTGLKGISLSGTTLTLSKNVLGTTNVTIKPSANYKLVIATDVPVPDQDGKPPGPQTVWRINGTTAYYKDVNPAYYTYDEKKNTIVYHKETDVKNGTKATITGLDKTKLAEAFDKEKGEIKGISQTGTVFTLTTDVLPVGTKSSKVTITGNNYSFKVDESVPTKSEVVTEWVTSGNTSTHKTYNKEYYVVDNKGTTITYTPATKGSTLATVTGIASGVNLNDVYVGAENTLKLTQDKLTNKTVKLSGAGYKLELVNVDGPKLNTVAGTPFEYEISGGNKVLIKGVIDAGYTLTNEKQITYTAGKGSAPTEEDPDAERVPVTLVTLSGFKFAKDGKNYPDISNGAIKIQTDGDDDDIEGNISIKTDSDQNVVYDSDGNAIIEVNSDFLKAGKVASKVSIGASEPYKLEIKDAEAAAPTTREATWNDDKLNNGTLTYQKDTTDGYTVSADGKTIEHTAKSSEVLATIKGLIKTTKDLSKPHLVISENDTEDDPDVTDEAKKITVDLVTVEDGAKKIIASDVIEIKEATYDSDGNAISAGEITLKDRRIFAGKSITIGNKENYNLVVDKSIAPHKFSDSGENGLQWSVKGTTAYLKDGMTDGYKASDNGKSVSYVAQNANITVAEIKGLVKGISVKENKLGTGKVNNFVKGAEFLEGNRISLADSILGTTNVSITSEKYEFADVGITEPIEHNPLWNISNGTAKLQETVDPGFKLNEDHNLLSYTAAKKNATLVTVSGLSKTNLINGNLTNNDSNQISVDLKSNVITLKNDALNAGKVTAKSGTKGVTYTFKLADDVMQKESANRTGQIEWLFSGTTATYKTYDKGYYSGEGTSTIVYTKPTAGTTHATVSNLKSGTTIGAFDKATKTIKLTDENLDNKKKNITLKGDAYRLDISDITASLSSYENGDWSEANSKGTATYSLQRDEGFRLSENGKTLTYLKGDSKAQTLITVSGLSVGTSVKFDENNVITIREKDVSKKSITLKGDGYTLALDKDVAASSIESGSVNSSVKSNTATFTGKVAAGYKLAPDAKSITYKAATAANKTETLAQITGVNQSTVDYTVSEKTNTITLTGTPGGGFTDKVGISGNVAFDFANYSNGTITGSKASDTLTVEGTYVAVNTGNGDDFVTLKGNNNVFFYASGNGNDVIANFNSSDAINITNYNVTAENIKVVDNNGDGNNDDAIIAIGSGSIKLQGYAQKDISIADKSKTLKTYVWDNGCYIEKVMNTGNAYALETSNLSLTPTGLTEQSDAIAYSGGSDTKK